MTINIQKCSYIAGGVLLDP